MFTKVLIANRGEIACRVLRTLKKLGIASVAVYSEADATSAHVLQADEAVCIGPAPAAESYLATDKILDAAIATGAQAIHPGYGFLSENADFAEACEARGIAFIGPTPTQMREFGLKHTARKLALDNDLPLLPGSGLLADLEEAKRESLRVGYPVMLKSTAGGGGIGMSLCADEAALSAAYESVSRLGKSFFKNGGMYVEKYVTKARHLEVQLFGDGKGTVAALGVRECSVQRRNQKVIEETPAPRISDELTAELSAAAVKLGQAVRYRSAGTVEFVYDDDAEQFYFLEVNTRLQVEHGVTESVTGLDLVEWMLRQAADETLPLAGYQFTPQGHSIQVRVYAEDPGRNFQPSPGVLTGFSVPDDVRCDTWVSQGTEVSAFYDPLIAKLIVHADTREAAVEKMAEVLTKTRIHGIRCNRQYLQQIVESEAFRTAHVFTRFLDSFDYRPTTMSVIEPGTYSSVQDYPGRHGYWDIGVPPSGPMDDLGMRLANRIVGNPEGYAALEFTVQGPTLRFDFDTTIALTGATMPAEVDGVAVPFWTAVDVKAGSTLTLGAASGTGCRAYLAVQRGFDVPEYLGSKSTFSLGQFGGHAGRPLRSGDVLEVMDDAERDHVLDAAMYEGLAEELIPAYPNQWQIGVLYGPHGAPDFFTADAIEMFFTSDWEVHYNSNRLGIRLNGPKPTWARADGGEAGLHPSNVHDCMYAVGSINFSGDMPIILTLDGPSLGGFVCAATIVRAEMWKVGQIKPGDTVRFVRFSEAQALEDELSQIALVEARAGKPVLVALPPSDAEALATPAIIHEIAHTDTQTGVVYRRAGDKYILIEYGPAILDLNLRFRVHALMEWLKANHVDGLQELSPGVRSLQIHYESRTLPLAQLMDMLLRAEKELPPEESITVKSRIVHLPMAFEDSSVLEAVAKYMQSVRKTAPYLPSNVEFMRRINGLDSIEQVRDIIFQTSYMVLGLGDVYLGAPCAVPVDPRHRLLTSKYNPARTFTPEGAVGIGGVYMCIYGMDSPGGYQLVGRTVPIWNKFLKNPDFAPGEPWLLRFFDQVRYYPVSEAELTEYRAAFREGTVRLNITEEDFNLGDYNRFLASIDTELKEFKAKQQAAFDTERVLWDNERAEEEAAAAAMGNMAGNGGGATDEDSPLVNGQSALHADIPGNIWRLLAEPGMKVEAGAQLAVIESMKMEFSVTAKRAGTVSKILCQPGQQVKSGQRLFVIDA